MGMFWKNIKLLSQHRGPHFILTINRRRIPIPPKYPSNTSQHPKLSIHP